MSAIMCKYVCENSFRARVGGYEIWVTSWEVGSKGHCRIRHTLGGHIIILGD